MSIFLTGIRACVLFPCQRLYISSEASSLHKLLVSKNRQGPSKGMRTIHWVGSCYRIRVCARVVYIASIHTHNNSSLLSSAVLDWTNCRRCASAIIAQAECLYSTHKGSHSGGFSFVFPLSPPHKGDPFQPLLAAPLSAFSSSDSLPWGCDWLKEENKDTRWMLRERLGLWQTEQLQANPTVVEGCLFLVKPGGRKWNWYQCLEWPWCLVECCAFVNLGSCAIF